MPWGEGADTCPVAADTYLEEPAAADMHRAVPDTAAEAGGQPVVGVHIGVALQAAGQLVVGHQRVAVPLPRVVEQHPPAGC